MFSKESDCSHFKAPFSILVTLMACISVLIINPIAIAKESIISLRTNQTSSFSDINENDWYFDNVNYLVDQKLTITKGDLKVQLISGK